MAGDETMTGQDDDALFSKEVMGFRVFVNVRGNVCIDQTSYENINARVEITPDQVPMLQEWLTAAAEAANAIDDDH